MARQKKEAEQPAGCPAWLATYGDMITLVLTFFVLLYSMSTIDVEKWKALVMNLSGNPYLFDSPMFTQNEGSTGSLAVPEFDVQDIIEESEDWFVPEVVDVLQQIVDKLNLAKAEGGEQGSFELEYNYGDPYVILRVQNDILFETAKADLLPEALPYIDEIVEMTLAQLRLGTTSFVEIEGHADERRLAAGSAFKDNEHLAAERAYSTWSYIIDNYEEAYGFFKFSSWGAAKPLVKESNEEAWRQNRRVEFYIYRNDKFDPAA